MVPHHEPQPQKGQPFVQSMNFSTCPQSQLLGVNTQNEHFYLVKNKSICVYQFHGGYSRKNLPQLIQQLIPPYEIIKFDINEHYISLYSAGLIEVRDRKYWNKVILTKKYKDVPKQLVNIYLHQHLFYISYFNQHSLEYFVEKYTLNSHPIQEQSNPIKIILGTAENQPTEIKAKHYQMFKPLFLNKIGNIKDLYIWSNSSKSIEIGMLFDVSPTVKRSFEINKIELKEEEMKLHAMYHHEIYCGEYPAQSPQYLLMICSYKHKIDKKIKVCLLIYQLLASNRNVHAKQSSLKNSSSIHSIETLLQDIKFLQRQPSVEASMQSSLINQLSAQNNCENNQSSLLKQVMREAILEHKKQEIKQKQSEPYFKHDFHELSTFQNCTFNQKQHKILISSKQTLIVLHLKSKAAIVEILSSTYLKNAQSLNSVVDSIKKYSIIPNVEKVIGFYQSQALIIQEKAINFQILAQKSSQEEDEEIAQEIEEDENYQNNENNGEYEIDKILKNPSQFYNQVIENYLEDQVYLSKKIFKDENDEQPYNEQIFFKGKTQIKDNFTQTQPLLSLPIETQTDQLKRSVHLEEISYTTQTINISDSLHSNKTNQAEKNQNHYKQQEIPYCPVKLNQFFTELSKSTYSSFQKIILKYSANLTATVSRASSKLKENTNQHHEQLQGYIATMIENQVKNHILPIFNQNITDRINTNLQALKSSIKSLLQEQLNNFNELILKHEIKENNIRGKKLYEYEKMIAGFKDTIEGYMQVCKQKNLQKIAIEQIMIQDSQEIKNKISAIENRMIEFMRNEETRESLIRKEIQDVFELIKQLQAQRDDSENSSREEEMEQSEENEEDQMNEEQSAGSQECDEDELRQSSKANQSLINSKSPSYIYPPYPYYHYNQSGMGFNEALYPPNQGYASNKSERQVYPYPTQMHSPMLPYPQQFNPYSQPTPYSFPIPNPYQSSHQPQPPIKTDKNETVFKKKNHPKDKAKTKPRKSSD